MMRSHTSSYSQRNSAERITLKSIVYLTDFSRSAEAALPFAKSMARAFDAKVYALHVLVPDFMSYMTPESPREALDQQERIAALKMDTVDLKFKGMPHESLIERADSLWQVLDPKLKQCGVDLVVLGTHGRTGLRKFVMGSTAERVLRQSSVPVMTVGPGVIGSLPSEGKFHHILLATDLREDCRNATAYAASLAQENEAELTLLHVIEHSPRRSKRKPEALSVAEAMHRLQAEVPSEAGLWCRSETAIELGSPGPKIVEAAKNRKADLVVLGVRDAEHLFAATHLEIRTAHEVVAHAACPVLCVPSRIARPN